MHEGHIVEFKRVLVGEGRACPGATRWKMKTLNNECAHSYSLPDILGEWPCHICCTPSKHYTTEMMRVTVLAPN